MYVCQDTTRTRSKMRQVWEGQAFTAKFYKVMTTVSTSDIASIMVSAILDTGAGLNLVWEDIIHAPW